MSLNFIEDTRELITFEKTLGLYSVAGAICSYGDVIDFVDGEKQAIIIADTCGKRKDYGNKVREFLREQIESGWGSSRDAGTEILDLGRRLIIAGTGKPIYDLKTKLKVIREFSEEERWWDSIEFCTAYFEGNKISLNGLRHLVYREKEKKLKRFGLQDHIKTFSPYHFDDSKDRESIETSLEGNDILIVTSDGLEWNMRLPYRTLEDSRKYFNQPLKDIEKIVGENLHLPVRQIRDALVSELSDYITGEYFADDVTFAVVKRT